MHILQKSLACVVLCLMVYCSQQTRDDANDQNDNVASASSRRHRHSMGGHNPFQDLVNALRVDGMTNTELYMHYTPSTPAPQNINCYVEVPTIVRRGGQCVQLGVRGGGARGRRSRRPWACQAGINLEISSYCQRVMQAARAGRRGRG
ncbi:uncharacterized protein LOC143292793 [Babylonia areolata]|uniref:uncharacterized protein LOC143292793 n=1 Tax=Babylonia areolata TaxID=304850 RepID=UPI003FD0F687